MPIQSVIPPIMQSEAITPRRQSIAAHVVLALFFYSTLLAPAAPINKIVFLVLAIWVAFDMIFSIRLMLLPTLTPFILFMIITYGLFLSFITWSEQAIAIQYFTSVFVLFIFYFVHRHRIQLDDVVVTASLLIIGATALFWMSIFWPDMPFASHVYNFFNVYNFSAAVDREFFEGGVTFTLQLGTAPFLFIGLCVVWLRYLSPKRRALDLPFSVLIISAILVSGLRGLVVISSVFLITIALHRARWPVRLLLISILFAAALTVSPALSESMIFNPEEGSNAGKIGHLNSFIEDMTISSSLFGRGLGNYYFSSGAGGYKSYTELSPIDLMRYVGIPMAMAYFILIIFPSKRLSTYAVHTFYYILAISLYIVLSITNPVMINSYGMLVVVWYWSKLNWR
jgi:hypothetical protein